MLKGEFSDMLHALQPTSKLYGLARTMFKNDWTQRQAQADALRANFAKKIAKIDDQIESLLDRMVDASNTSVIAA